jgi:hypothetical protein
LHRFLALVAAVGLATASTAQQREPDEVARIGAYVERYLSRAQAIVADENVQITPVGRGGFARRLVYETRFEWDPDAEIGKRARMTRRLLTVNGNPPKPKDKPRCADPADESPEPLAFMLGDERGKFSFRRAGVDRVGDRPTFVVEYRALAPGAPTFTEKDAEQDCWFIEVPGRQRGRVWADAATAAVLRVDESLISAVDVDVPYTQQREIGRQSLRIDQDDTSYHYAPVRFTNPDESIMLLARVESTVRGRGIIEQYRRQTFTNYRRFVTGARIVP